MTPIQGIHHITAVAGDPQRNWRFYTQVLGERMVKKTVNFDDPGTYHLYYGDNEGSPGSIMTFFPWTRMRSVPTGNNQVAATAYAVPENSLDFWAARFTDTGTAFRSFERFGTAGLAFSDPDGMPLELVAAAEAPDLPAWADSPVPGKHRLRGFYGATLQVPEAKPTLDILTGSLGMQVNDTESNRTRLVFPEASGPGRFVELVERPDLENYGLGAGIVHHIAFRARDKAHEAEIRDAVIEQGLQPTGHVDRDYFLSVYFREPNGILFEIATDPPGFSRDEPLESLGGDLKLPQQHEHLRQSLEKSLPPIPPKG